MQAGTSQGSSNLFNGNIGNLTSVGSDNLDPSIPLFVRVLAANACGVSAPTTDIVVDANGSLICVPNERTMCLFDGRFTVTLNSQIPGGAPAPALVPAVRRRRGFQLYRRVRREPVRTHPGSLRPSGAYLVTFNAGSGGIPAPTAFDLFIGDNRGSIARTFAHPGGAPFSSVQRRSEFQPLPVTQEATVATKVFSGRYSRSRLRLIVRGNPFN